MPRLRHHQHASPIESLVPPGIAFLYILLPPFLVPLFVRPLWFGSSHLFWPSLAHIAVETLSIGACLHILYARAVPRVLVHIQAKLARAGVHIAAVLFSTGVGIGVAYPVFLGFEHRGRSLAGFLYEVYAALFFASLIVAAAVSYQSLRRRVREEELRAQRAQEAAVRAELASLQARTNPHFLFNSLNTIAGLIADKPQLAEETVERVAEVLRHTLDAARHFSVPLAREVDVVKDYLGIERARFGERLRWSIKLEPGIGDIEVPPLLLLPLVENALHHGIYHRREGGNLAIDIRRIDIGRVDICRVDICRVDIGRVDIGRVDVDTSGPAIHGLAVQIDDDGPGPGGSTYRGTGTGLRDLRERVHLVFGSRARIELGNRPGGGCRAAIFLPLQESV